MQEEEFRKRLEQEEIFVSPMAFKALAGKGHPDFATSLQQDASEYLAHLFDLFEKDAKSNGTKDLSKLFTFEFEERLQMVSGEHNGKVSYKHVPETILKLPLPLAAVDNMKEVERSKKQKLEERKMERKSQKKSCQIFHFRYYWTSTTWATKLIFEMLSN